MQRCVTLRPVLTHNQHGGEQFKSGVKSLKSTINSTIVKEERSFFPVLGAISAAFVSSVVLRSRPGLGRLAATVSSSTVLVAYYPKTTVKAYKTLVKPLFTPSPASPSMKQANTVNQQQAVNKTAHVAPQAPSPVAQHVDAAAGTVSQKVQEVIDSIPVEKSETGDAHETTTTPEEASKPPQSDSSESAPAAQRPEASDSDDEVIEVIEEIVIEEVDGEAGNDDVVIIETTTTEETTASHEPTAHPTEQQQQQQPQPEGDMGQSEPEDLQTYPKRSESPQ